MQGRKVITADRDHAGDDFAASGSQSGGRWRGRAARGAVRRGGPSVAPRTRGRLPAGSRPGHGIGGCAFGRDGGVAEMTLPQRGKVSRLPLEALPSAPSLARRHAAGTMQEWGIPAEIAESAKIVISELVTNACASATTDAPLLSVDSRNFDGFDEISLTLRLVPGRLVIEVFDSSPKPPVIAAADSDSESGRGLMLVEALTKEWGFFFPPVEGKIVYGLIADPVLADLLPGVHRAGTGGAVAAGHVLTLELSREHRNGDRHRWSLSWYVAVFGRWPVRRWISRAGFRALVSRSGIPGGGK